ncbi:MAG: ATP-binding protein [Polyangiaceae bacterium]|nr:ATP-binding protein [Polyangiaceae bacterium]MCW5790153.1 ATP-binding protein [Polyangiaceae bacterium]
MARDLLSIAGSWSFWDRPLPGTVAREAPLPKALRDSLCLVVQGVRRCGKSTLLRQLVQRYKLDPRRCLFVNFEDPRLANELTHETLEALVGQFRARHPRAKRLYFFFDEIQGVEGWQRWLRSKLEQPAGDHFVITGSNATLLSGELSSTLTGRHLSVELSPFSLEECQRLVPGMTLERYLTEGGFPEPLKSEDRDALLRQYFDDIIERDVRERVAARSRQPIRQVMQMAYEAAGSELSLRRLAGAAGIAVETAAAYLEGAKSAYMLFECPYFAYSERKRASRNSKYYPIDPALRRVVVTKGGADLGKSLECAVYLQLRRHHRDIFYWRDGGEVDFVVQTRAGIVPVQVTLHEPQERHHASLERFYEQFPHAGEAVLVTLDNFADLGSLG